MYGLRDQELDSVIVGQSTLDNLLYGYGTKFVTGQHVYSDAAKLFRATLEQIPDPHEAYAVLSRAATMAFEAALLKIDDREWKRIVKALARLPRSYEETKTLSENIRDTFVG